MFVWEGGGGAPVGVGFINLVHSSEEMLSKLGGVNINPSLPCITERDFLDVREVLWECYGVACGTRQ